MTTINRADQGDTIEATFGKAADTTKILSNISLTEDTTMGDSIEDTMIINCRISSVSVAGGSISIDASTATQPDGIELRYTLDDWSDVATFTEAKGMYLRMQNEEANASGSIYGMQVYGVTNAVQVSNLWGGFFYAYVKGSAAVTIGQMYAVQAELSWDAGGSQDTLSTEAICVRAKVTSGSVDDYTNIHGVQVKMGDMDGGSRTYGNAFWALDDADMSGTTSYTVGLNLAAACTTGISLAGNTTTGMVISGTYTTGILVSGAGTDGIKVTGACTSAQIEVSGTAILASGEQAIYVNCAAETAATNGVWVTLKSSVTSGDLSAGRFKASTLRGTSGGPNVRGMYAQALSDTASKYAAILQGGLFVASYVGASTTATDIYGVTGFISQGSGLTCSGNLAAVQAHLQTRGDESIGVHTGVLITNEGVGGNGLALAEGAIYITETSLGGSVVGYECLIDASTSTLTDQTGNVVNLIKFVDAGGTARVLQYDSDTAGAVSVTTL